MSNFKKMVQARIDKTGESWSTAAGHVRAAAHTSSKDQGTGSTMPKLRFDLMADLREIYAAKLTAEGNSVDPTMDAGGVLAKYFSQSHRLIVQAPRRVEWSRELRASASSLPDDRKQALAMIESLAKSGGDLNPYQSRQIATRPDKADPQLLEWGIMHFHLGLNADTKHPGMIEGTSDLLFAVVRADAIYFVEILHHKDPATGHSSFSDDQLFNVAQSNWPDLFAHAVMRGVIGLERDISTEDREKLRRANINVPTVAADGRVYGSVQSGMTTSGIPVAIVQQHVMPMIKYVKNLEKWCREQPADVLRVVPPSLLEGKSEVTVRLIETPNGLTTAVDIPDAP